MASEYSRDPTVGFELPTVIPHDLAGGTAQAALDRVDPGPRGYGVSNCGIHVRAAIEVTYNIDLSRANYAWQYGDSLLGAGFVEIPNLPDSTLPGDVVVFSPSPLARNPTGHIQIRTTDGWVSDHVQQNFLPNRNHYADIPFRIYRMPNDAIPRGYPNTYRAHPPLS